MKVLITRPEPAASKTAKKLTEAGHEPVTFPMSKRQYLEVPSEADLGAASAFIFTSANAVHCCAIIDPELLQTPVYTVGKTTKRSALEAGFTNVMNGNGDGEALAQLIIEDHKMGKINSTDEHPLIYFTTQKRTPNLEQRLEQENIPVNPLLTYQMITEFSLIAFEKLFEDQQIDIVLFYSQSAVRRFFAAASESRNELFTSLRYGCLSGEIASAIPEEFSNQIDIAIEPSEHHLLACIGN